MRKPFYFTQKKCWYVKDGRGKLIRLSPDEQEAHEIWLGRLGVAEAGKSGDDPTYAALAAAWIVEHEPLLDAEKFKQLSSYVARFTHAVRGKLAKDVTKGDLLAWCKEPKPGRLRKDETRGPSKRWSKTTQGDAARAVKRVFAWAHDEGRLARNPLASLRVEQGESRRVTITYEQHAICVQECQSHVVPRVSKKNPPPSPSQQQDPKKKRQRKNPAFALYLIASRCGARPRQIREVTAASVIHGGAAWYFPDHKTAGKTGESLVVYLSPCLQTLTKILMARRKKHLFLNSDGNPWKQDTVSQSMDRLRKRVNIDAVTVYAYRHSFATDALLAGQSLAVVAELLGHKDTRMVGKVYGHLDQHKQHLLDAVAKTSTKRLEP